MVFINPYDGVDFSSTPRIRGNTHEHINNAARLKSAYDRGIRWFASVWYGPASPHYPYSGWNYDYLNYVNAEIDDLATQITNYTGSIASFVDADGNTINTDDLPQVPNAEHPKFVWDKSAATIVHTWHFNVLGNLWAEIGHGVGNGMVNKTLNNPLWDMTELGDMLQPLFSNKLFGTVNHCRDAATVKKFVDMYPNIFKAMEIFNHSTTAEQNQQHRDTYDAVLRQGYRIWGTAVVDWQGGVSGSETDFDRGCDVLYMPDWDSQSVSERAEAGLDCLIAGRYYASGLGNYKITDLTIKGNIVSLSVDGSPSSIKAVTSLRSVDGSGNTIKVTIQPNETYIRFEVAYSDYDFIYTNPIWIDDNSGFAEERRKKNLVLGII